MKWFRKAAAGLVIVAMVLVPAVSAAQPQYRDGMVMAVSDATSRGYIMAIVTIQEGRIAGVMLTEMNGFAVPKGPDYAWGPYHDAVANLPQRFIAANSADIDIFTQATSTSRMAMQAVGRALEKASTAQPTGEYFDGTFMGRSPDDGHGYAVAWVTLKGDRIAEVVLEEVTPDGAFKNWETYPWQAAVEGKLLMEERIIAAGHTDVEGVTGATSSATKYKQAVDAALRSAKQ